MTSVDVSACADCPLSLVIDEAHLIFAHLEKPSHGVRLELRDLGVPLAFGVSHRVKASFRRQCDPLEAGRLHDEIVFDWDAHSFFLPNFVGTLRFRSDTIERTRLLLAGTYLPPFGALGAIFDRLVGFRLASATLEGIVTHLARELDDIWARVRAAAPSGAVPSGRVA